MERYLHIDSASCLEQKLSVTTTLQPVPSSNSNLDFGSVSASTSAGIESSFAALCSALMPTCISSGATDPTATLADSTLANGGSETKSVADSARALPRERPDDKPPDTTLAFHPFLPSLLIATPFCAPVPPSPTGAESAPLLEGPDANSTPTPAIPVETNFGLAVSVSEPVQVARAEAPNAESVSVAAGSTGSPGFAEKPNGCTMSTAALGAGRDEVSSAFSAPWVGPRDQSAADVLSGPRSESSSIPIDAAKRDAEVLAEFDAPAGEREIVSMETGPWRTSPAVQLGEDIAPVRVAAPVPVASPAEVIDIAPVQIRGDTPERIGSAPAGQIHVPTVLGGKQKNSKLDAEISEEQKPGLAHNNLVTKQEPLKPAPAPLPVPERHIPRTLATDQNVAHQQAPTASTPASAASLAQDNEGTASSDNSKEKTTSGVVASGGGVLGKPSQGSRDEDDSSSTPGGSGSPTTTQTAVAAVSSAVTVSPPPADQGRITDAPIPQNHASSSNSGHNAMRAEMPAERTMSSEAAMPRLAGVEMARVIAKAGHSEMRIGLSTSAFGSVEVHTVVHADEVGVVIGSERGDLPGLIRSELPAISHNLQQQDVRLNQVNFQQQGFGFSAESQSGGHSQPRSFAAKGNFESLAVSQGASAESSPVIEPLGRPRAGLSILA